MAAADAAIARTRANLKGLEKDAMAALLAVGAVKAGSGQATETAAVMEAEVRAVKSVVAPATEATAAIHEVKATATQAAETVAALKLEEQALRSLGRQAVETKAEVVAASSGYDWNNLINATRLFNEQSQRANRFSDPQRTAGGAIPLGAAPSRTDFAEAERQYRDMRAAELALQRAKSGAIMLGAGPSRVFDMGPGYHPVQQSFDEAARAARDSAIEYGLNQARREFAHGAIPLGAGPDPRFGSRFGIPTEDLRVVSQFEQRAEEMHRVEQETLGSTMARDTEREVRRLVGAGGRGGRGGDTGFAGRGLVGGILPGGRRASAAAVTTGLGILAAAAPGAVPGIAGLAAAAAPTAIEGLVGAVGTLKLAFADLTAAAFTQQKAFDKLTPAQQQFVQTLRSLDAGLLKQNLEPLAQRILIPQLTTAIRSAMTPAAVGTLQGAVGGFASQMGGGARDFGRLFGSTGFQNALGPVLQADARAVGVLIRGLTNLFDALIHLQRAAIPFTNWLEKGGEAFTVWVDRSTKAAEKSGQLAHWFDMAKQSLQALGTLAGSLGNLLAGLFDAVGFQNSLSVIRLLAAAINTIAQFLKANRQVFNDFLAGAVKSAHDLLGLVQALLRVLGPFLTTANHIAKALGGWRVIIDAIVAYRFALILQGWALALGSIGLASGVATVGMGAFTTATVTGGAAAGTAAVEVGGLRGALLALGGADILAAVAALGAALVPVAAALGGVLASSGSAPNVPGLAPGAASEVARLAAAGKIPQGVLQAAARAGGIDPNTPTGRAFQNPNVVSYLYNWALEHHLTQAGVAAGGAASEAAAKGAGGLAQAQSPGHGSIYAKPPPLVGAGSAGAVLPTNLQLAISKASTTATTADDVRAINAALAYLNAHVAKMSRTDQIAAYNEISALQQNLTSLTKTTTAPGAVGPAGHAQNALSQAMAAFVSGTGQGTTPQQQKAAAENLLKVAEAQKKNLEVALTHAKTDRERLAINRELLTVERDIEKARKEEAKAQKEQRQAVVSGQIDRILGLGPAAIPGTQSLLTRERQILLGAMQRAGVHIPGAVNEPLTKLVAQMQARGIEIPKSTLESLHKINESIERARKEGLKLTSEQTQNITARLTQINDTLKGTSAHTNVRQMDPMGIVNRILPNGTRAQKLGLVAAISAGQALHGRVPTGGAAGGVPLPAGVGGGYDVPLLPTSGSGTVLPPHHMPHGAWHPGMVGPPPPLTSEHGRGQQSYHYDVKIVIDGTRTAKEIAREVRSELLKNQRRNGAQTKGPNAGRGVGLG